MDIERELDRLYYAIVEVRRLGKRHWKWRKPIRVKLQELWRETDLTAGEICDGLDIHMEDLADALDVSWDELRERRRQKKDGWELNIEAGLPLFIPLRITGLKEAISDVEF
jgi:hypothetical protein